MAADFLNLGKDLARAQTAGVDFIHIDVMDGHLVDDIAFGVGQVKAIRKATALPLDAHLMIAHPERFALRMTDAGAEWVTVQLEPCLQLYRTIRDIRDAGASPRICLQPTTPLCMAEELLPFVDGVLLVCVPLGLGGQSFIEPMYDKIARLAEIKKSMDGTFSIAIDGGVGEQNIVRLASAGADTIVAGTSLFAAENMRAAANALRSLAQSCL